MLCPAQPHQPLIHRLRQADGAALVDEGATDGLADPPEGVGREAITPAGIEAVHGPHQTEVALLHEVGQLQLAMGVAAGDR